MSKRESVLLKILIALIVVIFFVFTFSNSISTIKESKKSIDNYSKRIKTLNDRMREIQKNSLVEDVEIFEIPSLSIEEVASSLLNLLSSNGIKPDAYQISKGNGKDSVDFKLKCSVNSFMNFIYSFNEKSASFYFSSMNVRFDNDLLDIKFKAVNEPCLFNYSFSSDKPYGLSSMFPYVYVEEEKQEDVVTVADIKKEVVNIFQLKVIGTIVDSNGIKKVCLKNDKNGRVYNIPEKEIIKKSDNKFGVTIDGEQFEFIYKGL